MNSSTAAAARSSPASPVGLAPRAGAPAPTVKSLGILALPSRDLCHKLRTAYVRRPGSVDGRTNWLRFPGGIIEQGHGPE